MRNLDEKPERISVGLIGCKLGIGSLLEKHIDKLTLAKEYINSLKDNDDDYHIRKIKCAITELKMQAKI